MPSPKQIARVLTKIPNIESVTQLGPDEFCVKGKNHSQIFTLKGLESLYELCCELALAVEKERITTYKDKPMPKFIKVTIPNGKPDGGS
jgi:hypothetical protein